MRLAVVVLAIVLLAPASARAGEPAWSGPPGAAPSVPLDLEPPPAPPTITREVSYANLTLALDGLAAGLFVLGAMQDEPEVIGTLMAFGLDLYFFGAPIAHLTKRRFGAGAASFGLRIALPLVGAAVGYRIGPRTIVACDIDSHCSGPEGSLSGLLLGLGAGALAAVIVDAGYLARKRVTEPAPWLAPTVSAGPTGFSLGLGGSF